MSDINLYFDKIFYINLDRRPDRNQNVINRFKEVGISNYERFSAVDARLLNFDYSPTYKAELATLLSHLSIYKIAVDRNYKKILIFEDDIVFDSAFSSIISDYMMAVPIDWDMLYLGGNDRIKPKTIGRFNKLTKTFTTHAYSVNSKFLPRVIQHIETIYNQLISRKYELIPGGVDYYLAQLSQFGNIYGLDKYLVYQEEGYSDIQNKNVDYNKWLLNDKNDYEKPLSLTKKAKKIFKIKEHDSFINKVIFRINKEKILSNSIDSRLNVIIFSKDRAMQLHALLESIRFNNVNIFDRLTVLYKASDSEFEKGYSILKQNFAEVTFVNESDFKNDLIEKCLDKSYSHTCFLVDDNLFYRSNLYHKHKILELVNEQSICFSLRLGINCVYSHPADKHFKIKNPELLNGLLKWDYTKEDVDFNYPLALDGHVFSTSLIYGLIKKTKFKHPNSLEAGLQKHNNKLPKIMHSFEHSILVGLPINMVNSEVKNRVGLQYYFSEKTLNEKYISGERIDLKKLDFENVIGAHQEVQLFFR